ncbi:MAG: hypothetical protein H6812_04630 [Phycisphaeraceae bacterium]|nr:hypothetical protein [Phycisphaeraceae bacterium]
MTTLDQHAPPNLARGVSATREHSTFHFQTNDRVNARRRGPIGIERTRHDAPLSDLDAVAAWRAQMNSLMDDSGMRQ